MLLLFTTPIKIILQVLLLLLGKLKGKKKSWVGSVWVEQNYGVWPTKLPKLVSVTPTHIYTYIAYVRIYMCVTVHMPS